MNILFFLIFVIIIEQPKEVSAATVRISGHITDFRNTNGNEIECSFTGSFDRIIFLATNKSSGSFESIAYSKSNENPNLTLTEFGNLIFGNVTTSFKTKSKSILFNDLSCLHVRTYKCQLWIDQSDGNLKSIDSTIMNISIKVRPSKPEMSFPSQVFSRTTNQYENSTNSSTNRTRLNRSSQLMSNKGITEKAFTEGDNITFRCDGGVGRPKGKFIWRKIYSNKRRFNYTSIPTETTLENCTFSGTSNLTIQVTAEDNLAKIRCIVKSEVSEEEMSADSEPLLIYFQVRKQYISIEPNETVYKEGELVQLNCKGYGNPYPSYSWTKGNNSDEKISDNETLVIQNVTISDSGLFTCNTSNEINSKTYYASRSREIIIVKVPSVVRINQNITKRKHSNGIKLNCSYHIGSQDAFESIALAAQNVSADQFQDTTDRKRNTTQTLTAFGVYLFGNATAVFKSTNALMLEFNNLEPRHERLYKCILNVYPRNNQFIREQIESDVMTITVTAEEIITTDSEHKTDIIVVVTVPVIVLHLLAVAVVVGVKLRRTRTQASFGIIDGDEKNSQTTDTDCGNNQQGTTMYVNPQDDVDDTSSSRPFQQLSIPTVENDYDSQNKEYQQENDMYADPIDGVYETLGVKRYKEVNNCEQLDTVKNISAESNKSTKSKDITIMLNRSPKSHDKLMSSGYESVDMTGETLVINSASPANEHDDADVVKQRNEKDMEEDDKINKSQISHKPVEYATLIETTKLKNINKENNKTPEKGDTSAEIHKGNKDESEERLSTTSDNTKQIENIHAEMQKRIDDISGKTVDNANYFNTIMHPGSLTSTEHTKQKENINAKTQEGIEERPGRVVDNAGYFDTTLHLMDQQTNGGQETAKRDDQTKTYTNQAFETEEDQLADEVSSQFRLLDGFQDGGERNQNVD